VAKIKPIFTFKTQLSEDGVNYKVVIEPSSQEAFNKWSVNNCNKLRKFSPSGITKKTIRSIEQNAYYWGVVIKIIADNEGYIGPGEKEDIHEALKAKFLVKKGPFGDNVIEQTSKLSTDIFELYLEAIRSWYLDWSGIRIPMPNEAEGDSDTYIKL